MATPSLDTDTNQHVFFKHAESECEWHAQRKTICNDIIARLNQQGDTVTSIGFDDGWWSLYDGLTEYTICTQKYRIGLYVPHDDRDAELFAFANCGWMKDYEYAKRRGRAYDPAVEMYLLDATNQETIVQRTLQMMSNISNWDYDFPDTRLHLKRWAWE